MENRIIQQTLAVIAICTMMAAFSSPLYAWGWSTKIIWQDVTPLVYAGTSFCDVVGGGDGQFVASGLFGQIAVSSDNGKTWTKQTSKLNGTINKIIYANGQYIAVSSPSGVYTSASRIITSKDAKNWEVNTGDYIDIAISLFGITTSGSRYVVVGYDHGGILISDDAKTWTNQHSGLSNDAFIMSVIWSPQQKLFVAVADAGAIITSPDGINWTRSNSGTSNDLYAVTYSTAKKQFIAVGTHGTILSSSDGKNWQTQVSGTDQSLAEVIWADKLGRYYTVGNKGTILSSANGLSWVAESSGTNQDLSGIASLGKKLVVVGNKIILVSK